MGACALFGAHPAAAQPGSELRFSINSEPKTLNPLLVDDDASETIRYLTGGVLVRLNRLTQQLQPELGHSVEGEPDRRRDPLYPAAERALFRWNPAYPPPTWPIPSSD